MEFFMASEAEWIAGSFAALALAIGAAVGRRVGARRALTQWTRMGLAWSIGGLTACACLRAGWLWPLGLLTPAVLGSMAGLAAARWAAPPTPPATPPATLSAPPQIGGADRRMGAVVGAGTAMLAITALWFVLSTVALVDSVARQDSHHPAPNTIVHAGATTEGEMGDALRAVLDTTHRGLVRHLPIVGSWSDELAALIHVLDAPVADRRRLALDQDWQHLAELPAMQAALRDEEVTANIQALGDGDLLALYRLQRSAVILELLRCPKLRPLVEEFRPSTLAARLGR